MSGREPRCAPPSSIKERAGDTITQKREYCLITPLFGGGVEPEQADPVTVVRGTEVRGQLRFWWRACRGGQFNGDLEKMRKREGEIWGAAAVEKKEETSGGPSQVQVEILPLKKGVEFQAKNQREQPVPVGDPRSPYSYVAFPLNESKGTVLDGVSFQLRITYPDACKKDVEAALWAWETFGGIGARTRRGFGALHLLKVDNKPHTDLPPADAEGARRWLDAKFAHFVADGTPPEDVPHLALRPQFIVIANGHTNPLAIWKWMIHRLRDFRQHRRRDRNGKAGRGRSNWCEPTAIREITGQSHPHHSTPIPNPSIVKFPRAVFGLPIGFQFKDADRKQPDKPGADPRKTSLESESHDRLSSPLILRPLACAGGKYVGIALLLSGTRLPDNLILKGAPEGQEQIKVQLNQQEAKQIPVLNGNPKVLQAFFDYLKSKS